MSKSPLQQPPELAHAPDFDLALAPETEFSPALALDIELALASGLLFLTHEFDLSLLRSNLSLKANVFFFSSNFFVRRTSFGLDSGGFHQETSAAIECYRI